MGTPYYWSVNLQGIGYDGVYIDKAAYGDFKLGIMDTGTSLIHLPKKYYNMLVEAWKEQLGTDNDDFYEGASGLMEGHGDCSNTSPWRSSQTLRSARPRDPCPSDRGSTRSRTCGSAELWNS